MTNIEAIKIYINTIKICLKKTPTDENLKGQLFAYENCLNLFEADANATNPDRN